ncbi:MAG: class I tRNA ligase family protein, partial [Planctomycetes bacterium]|nr:class I tRNA ligase family protein [Planctomycetota bacterium]
KAMEVVLDGRVKFVPERYAQTYLDWLSEKRDWCISRQLWWGHRIPVWRAWSDQASAAELAIRIKTYMHDAGVSTSEYSLQVNDSSFDVFCCAGTDLAESALRAFETFLKSYIPPIGSELTEVPGFVGAKHAANELFTKCASFEQDPDVLDTWFSSQLWPHSTFGWPDKTPELAYYYPTSTLVTSRDIITLWVARMVISGLYNMGDVPFKHVYITPKLLDGFGETMSKSKGNGVDPLDIIDLYGTDALRFVIVSACGETQDSRLPVANVCPHCQELVPVKQEHMYLRTKKLACPKCKKPFRPGGPWPEDDPELPTAKQGSERFELGRNFANKMWNAARFILMNLDGYTPGVVKQSELPIEDRWILSRLATTIQAVTASLEGYRFSEVARLIYDFTWTEFCDWYIEMAKGRFKDPASQASVQRVLVGVLDGILKLVQPVMPFVAESIWQALNEAAFERGLPSPDPAAESVVIAPWPSLSSDWQDQAMETRFARMQELVRIVREVRNRYMVDGRTPLDLYVRCTETVAADLRSLSTFLILLAGVGKLECGPDVKKPSQAATQVNPEFEAYVSLKGLIDPVEEVKRLDKQLAEKTKQMEATKKKLANADFVARAPKEVVEQQHQQVAELEQQIRVLGETIGELKAG